MQYQRIPSQINYQRINPIGFPQIYKQWRVSPMSSNKRWANNDIVRFSPQGISDGVFDPYRSYIQITVSVDPKDLPVGLLQIDNSAQSFFDQMVIYSNNSEVERITDYSVIAAYLSDIGYNEFVTEGRQIQGLGYSSFSTPPYGNGVDSSLSCPRYYDGNQVAVNTSPGTIFPTISNSNTGNHWKQASLNVFESSKITKGHISSSNAVIVANDMNDQSNTLVIDQAMKNQGHANNMRSQYLASYRMPRYIDKPSSIPTWGIGVSQDTVTSSKTSSASYPFKYNPNNPTVPYQTDLAQRSQLYLGLVSNKQSTVDNYHANTCSNFGFGSLFSPLFTRGTFQPFISPTVPQCQIQKGIILPYKVPISSRRFKIPLLSGLIGIGIDQKSYMLLPLGILESLLIELTLDPYAMFTSGYVDFCELDDVGMNVQQRRCYQIDRIQWRIQTYHFSDNDMKVYIKQSLRKQILFTSSTWSLGNKYQVPGNTPLNNNYIVGCNSTFLSELVCLIVPCDYQVYSFCRKHFRISANVRKFWARFGVDYWPPQPIQGHGGNVYAEQGDYDSDNSVYVENIYQSNQYCFSNSTPMPRINPWNFAVNERAFDPTNKNTFYDHGLYNNPNFVFGATTVNADTALGMSWIHQNRLVGRAAYTIPLTPFQNEQGFIYGVNVRGMNNLEVVFEADSQNVFPRDHSLYIFCKSSVAYLINQQGVTVQGR